MRKQLILPNNCRASIPTVIPKNWKTVHASLKKHWTICYRFYDPACPQPKQVQIRQMNHAPTLKDRQELTRNLLDQEIKSLKAGYNPITRTQPQDKSFLIDPDTPVFNAISAALNRKKIDNSTRLSIESSLKMMQKSAIELRLSNMPVSEIRRRHIKMILSHVQDDRKLSASSYNHYRAYLSMLFDELTELECIEFNPVANISKQAEPKKLKIVLTKEQREKIDLYFKENNYPFWRYIHLFFHSGCRTKELFSLKRSAVSLEEQTFIITVKKGKQMREVKKVIKDAAVDLWKELCSTAKPDDYLFSFGFKPGSKRFTPDRPTKIWAKHVKKGMGIAADFYSIKHLHSTEVSDLISQAAAAKHNSHTSTAMVRNIYDINSAERELEQLKKLNNKF